jgi:hypothetical protein
MYSSKSYMKTPVLVPSRGEGRRRFLTVVNREKMEAPRREDTFGFKRSRAFSISCFIFECTHLQLRRAVTSVIIVFLPGRIAIYNLVLVLVLVRVRVPAHSSNAQT